MKKQFGAALLAAAALVLLPVSVANATETAPVHTGYYYYAANDYEHQTLYSQANGNTLPAPEDTTTPPPLADLPCGTWSIQGDVVPAAQVFPATLNPNATPLHPSASFHWLQVKGDCTPPPITHTHSKHATERHHAVVSCRDRRVDTTHVVTTVYKTDGKVTKTTHRTYHTYRNLTAEQKAKCSPVAAVSKNTPKALAYTGDSAASVAFDQKLHNEFYAVLALVVLLSVGLFFYSRRAPKPRGKQ
jgi:hypothetical protein